jgi:hypothetical protein
MMKKVVIPSSEKLVHMRTTLRYIIEDGNFQNSMLFPDIPGSLYRFAVMFTVRVSHITQQDGYSEVKTLD